MAALFTDSDAPRSILVVCTRRIGDVLLATPIVRSLKASWPDAQIDMLVFNGTGGVLENNPDLRRVISVAQRASLKMRLGDARRIWRKYDLACAAMTSDRASFYSWFAGRKRIGIVSPAGKSWFKRLLLNRYAVEQASTMHMVQSGLLLLPLLDLAPCAEVVAPGIGGQAERIAHLDHLLAPAGGKPLASVHVYPMYTYKMWHTEGWLAVIAWLDAHGYAVVLTGGPAEAEVAYTRAIAAGAGGEIINLAGQLSLGETAEVIRRSKLFIGPDTSASHIAAATGTPTITLFGPSNPVRWGPWPKDWRGEASPWKLAGSGRRGNVYLLQGSGACVPCKLEGCEANIHSWSDCLLMLDANRVIDAAAELLGLAPDKQRRIPIVSLSVARPQRRIPSETVPAAIGTQAGG
jgi:heptosyltransferase-3